MIRQRPWLPVFAVATMLAVTWAIATPLFASPDEPAHIIKAAGTVRGQPIGVEAPDGLQPRSEEVLSDSSQEDRYLELTHTEGTNFMELPAILAMSHGVGCFAFRPNVTADCLSYEGSQEIAEVGTTAGRHPPFYYAVVGLPTLIEVEARGIYTMRLFSALVAAALLAAAWVSVGSLPNPRTARLGLAVAITPMLAFLSGTVNPSAWEIAAAILLWSSGFTLIAAEVRPTLVTAAGVAAVVLALTRQLGPMWVVLILAALIALTPPHRRRELGSSRTVRLWGIATAGALLFQIAWIAIVRPLDTSLGDRAIEDLETSEILRVTIGRSTRYLYEMVGWFGWLESPSPTLTYLVWTVVALGMVLVALAVGARHEMGVLLIVGVLTFVIPILAQLQSAREAGFYWQGRYTLPLAVGVPLLAAVMIARRAVTPPRVFVTVGVALGVAQVLAFFQSLRRFSAGARSNKLWFWTDAAWSPPLPILVLLGAFIVLVALWYWVLLAPQSPPDAVDDRKKRQPANSTG